MTKFMIFTLMIFLLTITNVYAQANVLQTVYQIRAIISRDDSTQLNEITAFNSTLSAFPTSDTGYSIKVVSNDGRNLFDEFLGVSFTVSLDPVGVIHLNQTTITTKVPYHSNAKSIGIYHSDKKILDIDLSKDFCNNNSICDLGENIYNCPKDCMPAGTQSEIPWFYIGIAGIAAIVLVIYLIRKNYTIQV